MNVSPGRNHYGAIDSIEATIDGVPFDLDKFNYLTRRNIGGHRGEGPGIPDGTVRWQIEQLGPEGSPILGPDGKPIKIPPPTIHVDDQTVVPILTQYNLHDTLDITLREYIAQTTDNYFRNAIVVRHPRSSTLPKDGTERALIIRYEHTDREDVGGFLNIYINRQNYIYSCTFVLTQNIGKRGIVQDVCQCASGLWNNYHDQIGGPLDSIYNHFMAPDVPTPKDKVFGKVQFRIPVGTRSPYDTSHLGAIDPKTVTPMLILTEEKGTGTDDTPVVSPNNNPAEIIDGPTEKSYGRTPRNQHYKDIPEIIKQFNPSTSFFANPARRANYSRR